MGFADLLAAGDVLAREHLGSTVTYSPTVGADVDVDGIFDAAYVRTEGVGVAGVSTSGPAVFLTLADLPSDPSVDLTATVTIGGTEYAPHERQPDGMGGVLLHLHEVV